MPQNNDTTLVESRRFKAVQLLTYLKELCALRTTQVRNVESYDQVFWLSQLPRNKKLCRSNLWRLIDPPGADSDQRVDPWIEVKKPSLKSPPELPDDVEPWAKEAEIVDSSLSEPGFNERIPLSALQGDDVDANTQDFVSINDYPQVFDKWISYVETKWKPWAEQDRELQKVYQAYNQLFDIYQRQEKLGEQYEVIIGAGFLAWDSPTSGKISRHILAIQSRIEFDRNRGVMTVNAALDGPQPLLEHSMLEPVDRPNPGNLTAIENDVSALDGEPWDIEALETVLRGFANSLPVTGDYERSIEHSGATPKTPLVRLAPALILRKRTRRTFEAFYQHIIDQIEQGGEIPENIRRIIEIVDDPSGSNISNLAEERVASTPNNDTDSDELYFPLPSNKEQKRIVRKVDQQGGVLVQGPPGTGKSHTIANLICHYLAQGKRLLVTSETPRALGVLRRKLPKEIEELCVIWLGSGPESQLALEKSVSGITHRKANWDEARENAAIIRHSKRLDSARKEQARLRHELRACREADVYEHSGVFGRYSGTQQQIAVMVNQERNSFQWFQDRPDSEAMADVRPDELVKMLQVNKSLTADLIEQLKFRLFPIAQLISPAEFRRLIAVEQSTHKSYEDAKGHHSYAGYEQLSSLDRLSRDKIISQVEEILVRQEAISKSIHPWAARACKEIAGDQDRVWRHILTTTKEQISRVDSLLAKHGKIDAVGLYSKDLRLVRQHLEGLVQHLKSGRGLGFGIFRARPVKEALYLLQSVKIDGLPCDNLDALARLSVWIDISTALNELGDIWRKTAKQLVGDATTQCHAYRDRCEPVEQALELYALIEQVKVLCPNYAGIHMPAWHHTDEIAAFKNAIEATNLGEDYAAAQRAIISLAESLQNHFDSGRSHSSTVELLRAVQQRDCGLYQEAFDWLTSLNEWAKASAYAQDVLNRFRNCARNTCINFEASSDDPIWGERFPTFNVAWQWAQAERWLENINEKDRFKKIQRALDDAASQERGALRDLAAGKAWRHCISRLHERERMALVAWSLAVGRIRSGTGKYAEKHRESARQKLDECRIAIPAWVMPLYQVVQTTRPRLHQFDIAIIDEASQSGPESLLLNYIADKIIVVGDDKQITPMHIGIERSAVEFLQRKYLKDIPHSDALDLDGSLYSQANLRFPDKIRLCEHFRCMPEIIQFSNQLSYAAQDPLIPLRQYGANRLEPVKAVFVNDGYRKGSSSDIENPPEATAIVAQIAECCENPLYEGKTFGVICLQGGNKQTNLLNSLLRDEIGTAEIDARQILCGRPYDFQGDERDVIFLSLVDAPSEEPIRSITNNLDMQRRYNVAASRARDQLWLFHSMTLNDLRPGSYQYRLLEYCQNPSVQSREDAISAIELSARERDAHPPEPFDSWFEVDVFIKIQGQGFRVLPQYEVAFYRIDLVVEGLNGRLAVECDGDKWHGPEKYEDDMARQRDLERCGWSFWRVRGSEYYRDPDAALAGLWDVLQKLNITPRSSWESDRKQSEEVPAEQALRFAAAATGEDESEGDAEEKELSPSLFSTDQANDRLEGALSFVHSRQHAIDQLPPVTIQNAIARVLQQSPNHTCTLKSLTSRVLKELGVQTRGNPRLEFEKRVMRNLGALKRKSMIEEYKAKNRRIRLLSSQQASLPL